MKKYLLSLLLSITVLYSFSQSSLLIDSFFLAGTSTFSKVLANPGQMIIYEVRPVISDTIILKKLEGLRSNDTKFIITKMQLLNANTHSLLAEAFFINQIENERISQEHDVILDIDEAKLLALYNFQKENIFYFRSRSGHIKVDLYGKGGTYMLRMGYNCWPWSNMPIWKEPDLRNFISSIKKMIPIK